MYRDTDFESQDLEKSKVLYIKGIRNLKVNVKILTKLFSAFGNVEKILKIKDKFSALI
jgi:hypothetical protein